MAIKPQNFLQVRLAAGISASATVLTLRPGDGQELRVAAGDYMYLSLSDGVNNEIVKYASRGPVLGDSIVVTRAQDGTIAHAFAPGTCVVVAWNFAQVRELISEMIAAIPPTVAPPAVVPPAPVPALQVRFKSFVLNRTVATVGETVVATMTIQGMAANSSAQYEVGYIKSAGLTGPTGDSTVLFAANAAGEATVSVTFTTVNVGTQTITGWFQGLSYGRTVEVLAVGAPAPAPPPPATAQFVSFVVSPPEVVLGQMFTATMTINGMVPGSSATYPVGYVKSSGLSGVSGDSPVLFTANAQGVATTTQLFEATAVGSQYINGWFAGIGYGRELTVVPVGVPVPPPGPAPTTPPATFVSFVLGSSSVRVGDTVLATMTIGGMPPNINADYMVGYVKSSGLSGPTGDQLRTFTSNAQGIASNTVIFTATASGQQYVNGWMFGIGYDRYVVVAEPAAPLSPPPPPPPPPPPTVVGSAYASPVTIYQGSATEVSVNLHGYVSGALITLSVQYTYPAGISGPVGFVTKSAYADANGNAVLKQSLLGVLAGTHTVGITLAGSYKTVTVTVVELPAPPPAPPPDPGGGDSNNQGF